MSRLQRYSNVEPIDFPPPPPPLSIEVSPLYSPPSRTNLNYNSSHETDSFPPPPPPAVGTSSPAATISSTFQPQQTSFSTPLRLRSPKFSRPVSHSQQPQASFSQTFSQTPTPPTTPFRQTEQTSQRLQRNLSRTSNRSSLSLNLEDLSRALAFLDNATLELELFSQLSPNSLLLQDGEPLFTSEEIEKLFNGHAGNVPSSGANTIAGHRQVSHTASNHPGTRFDIEHAQQTSHSSNFHQKALSPGHPSYPGQYSTISGPYLSKNVETRKTLIEPNSSSNSSFPSKNRSIKAQSMVLHRPQATAPDGSGIQVIEPFKHTDQIQAFQKHNAECTAGRTPPTKVTKNEVIHSGTIWIFQYIANGLVEKPKKGKKTKNGIEAYGILIQHFLLLYKNEKTAFEGVKLLHAIPLFGATICWDLNLKPFRFEVATPIHKFQFHHTKEENAKTWVEQIGAILNSQTKPEGFTRNASYKPQMSHESAGTSTPPSDRKLLNIRERLKQLLRFRPTVDILKEKGIFREELIFNRSLDELCVRDNHCVPRFVRDCVDAIEKKDMKAEGLYRACGNLSSVQKLRFEINSEKYQTLYAEDDVHVLTGLLKMFFRTMAEPLFPSDKFVSLLNTIDLTCSDTDKIHHFKDILSRFPTNNLETIRFLLKHLLHVIDYSRDNRMNIQNLAIVFGPTLLRPKEDSKNLFIDMSSQINQCRIVEFLLKYFHPIFESTTH